MSDNGAPQWSGKWFAKDFKLGDQIGKGGMSAVYRATHQPSGGEFAVKLLTPRTPQDRDHLKREIEISVKIINPCVIRTHGYEKVGDDLWIFMELFDGQSLKNVLRDFLVNKTRYPFYELRKYLGLFRALAVGLQAIHRANVVHCDIKPENIMIGNNEFRVHDFGIAREIQSVPEEISGTTTYMAPEQIKRDPVDARTDIYALGVTMWEMALGMPPFVAPNLKAVQDGLDKPDLSREDRWTLIGKFLEGRSMNAAMANSNLVAHVQGAKAETMAMLENHLKVKPHIPASFPYPVSVARVLLKCLEKDRRSRWNNAQELIDELERLTAVAMELPKPIKPGPAVPGAPAGSAGAPRASRVDQIKAKLAQMKAAEQKQLEDEDADSDL